MTGPDPPLPSPSVRGKAGKPVVAPVSDGPLPAPNQADLPFMPTGSFVDPSHVVAIWVEPETLARIGIGALPLDLFDDSMRDRAPPAGLFDAGPVEAIIPPETFPPKPGSESDRLAGFPGASVDVGADYLFRVLAFMRSECDVVRVEAMGARTDAPLRLVGFRNDDFASFDDSRAIVIAAVAPREKF